MTVAVWLLQDHHLAQFARQAMLQVLEVFVLFVPWATIPHQQNRLVVPLLQLEALLVRLEPHLTLLVQQAIIQIQAEQQYAYHVQLLLILFKLELFHALLVLLELIPHQLVAVP